MEERRPFPAGLTPARGVAAFVAVAFLTAGLRSPHTDGRLVAVAAVAAALLLALAALVPWRRLPVATLLVVPVLCDAVIAVLRDSQGGSRSGYSPLLVLPVVWCAFVVGRRGVIVLVAATALTLIAPILLAGAPDYPSTTWRGSILLTAVAAIVGAVVARGVSEGRRRTDEAVRNVEQLDRLLRTQTAIAMSDFGLDDVLQTVAEQARELTGADAAVVELPDGPEMVYRAVAGTAAEFAGVRIAREGSLSGLCLELAEPLVVDDCELDSRVDLESCRRVGARSMVCVPLVHGGEVAGVLKVYSGAPGAVGRDEARVLGLLAHAIGTALVRAELVATLSEHAVTDSLTGLANRRSWDEQLARALAHAARSNETVSVAVCDVDGLKRINDLEGHAAGDALIREVGDCLARGARAADLLARIGGDEFALLLPGADKDAADEVVARLTRALPSGRTVSVGVAEWDGREGPAELLERADARMYERKRDARAGAGARI